MPQKSLKEKKLKNHAHNRDYAVNKYLQLASYACHPEESKGRLYKEQESNTRTVFQRDRDRIIHSTAFRRLEYKTQVFVNHEGDHYRTRLTHSLEVAQLARSASRQLLLNEDLAEALALTHDLGHPPFGHAGEDALKECMKNFDGFDHNAQAIRLLTSLEQKYAEFDGLNLTWETLEGIAKHNGPIKPNKIPKAILEYNKKHDLKLNTYPSCEAQIASLCDDIAYNSHDLEDGLRAGLLKIEEVEELPLIGEIFFEIKKKYKDIPVSRLKHEAKRKMINLMSVDLVEETIENIKDYKIQTVDDVRNLKKPVAHFSNEMAADILVIKKFLFENVYRHYKVNRMTSKAKRLVKDLFEFFVAEPECLPTEWRKKAGKPNSKETAILVADFIAGMTDRFALEEHKKIFDISYKIIGDYTN